MNQPFPSRADKQRSERSGVDYGLGPESSRGAQFSKGVSGGHAGTNGKSWSNFLEVTLACGASAIPKQPETFVGFNRIAARPIWNLTSHPATDASDMLHETECSGSDQGSGAASRAFPAPAGGTRRDFRTDTPPTTRRSRLITWPFHR